MELLQIRCGGDRNFGYLLLDGGEAALVDPGADTRHLLQALEHSGARLRWVLATHTHVDHVEGLGTLPAGDWDLVCSPLGRLAPGLGVPETGLNLPLGAAGLEFWPTPGHTPCSLCVLCRDAAGRPTDVLTGDTLFVGKVGGTSDAATGRQEYDSLHRVLLALPDDVRVWPGHDYGVGPNSTIGHERRSNPFLLQPDPDAFLRLKENWAAYKEAHGIA